MENNKKSFLSHFMSIGLGTVINMMIGFLTTPIITRLVEPEYYGQFSIFTMYTGIAVMILCLGLDQALVRFFYDKDELSYKQSLFKECFIIPIAASLIVSAVISFLAYSGIIKFEFTPFVMLLLCVNIVISVANRITILVLRITYQSKKFAVCNVLTKVVYVSAALIMILTIKSHYFVLLASATVLSVLASTIYAVTQTKEMWNFKSGVTIDRNKIIKYGLPLILSMGITTLFQAIDKISLNAYCTYEEVGVYSSAMTLVNIFAIVQSTFNSLWGPMQVEHYTKHPEDTGYIQKANQMITVIMFGLGICLILVKDVFALLLGEKFREAAYIMPFLIFNPIMYTISETTSAGIGYSKKSYLNICVAAGACITNFIGNTILVPKLGCQGAAISTGVSYFVFMMLRMYFSNRYYPVNYKLGKFLFITVLTSAYALYNTFFDFGYISIIEWAVLMAVLLLLYKSNVKDIVNMGLNFIKKKK